VSEPGADRARLFVAIDLPVDVREALVAWRAHELGGHRQLRMVEQETLHVTLCFLGGRPEREIETIGALVLACAAPVTGLCLGAALWLPRARPRLVAVELSDEAGALAALQKRLAEELLAAGVYAPESRPFWPHVTVARVRRSGRLGRVDELGPPPPLAFGGAALTLYRSRLSRAGAVYEPLAQVER